MTATLSARLTAADYFALDTAAEDVRYELWYGQIVAMAGETYDHNAIKDDIVAALRKRLPCDVLSSGLRVAAPAYGRANYAYPDAVVICDQKVFDTSTNPPTLLNPTLLVEVTSASTAARDRGEKLDAYLHLDSLREYWVIEPGFPFVLRYFRVPGGATVVQSYRSLDDTLHSEALGVALPLREIYQRVDWQEAETAA